MDHYEKSKREPHPQEKANIFSIISFFYTLKLFRKGYKRDLQENDLYEVLPNYRSKKLGDQLEKEWDKQKKLGKANSIMRLLWACYGKEYLLLGVIQLLVKTAMITLQPRALGRLIAYFVPGQTELTKFDAYYYAAVIISLNVVSCIYVHNYHLMVTGMGIKIRTAFCSFIYRKTLRLSPSRLNDISIGKIVTLMTKDVHSFETFIHFANDLWIAFVKTAVICFLIYDRIGVAALAGVGFFFVMMPLQILMGKWAASLRMKMCTRTDERLQITQETLSAIKIIKMYTWEKFFNNKVTEARRKEIQGMHKTFYLKFTVLQIGELNAKVAYYLLIMTYAWLGNQITAEIVYFILSNFTILSHTLSILFPLAVSHTAELFAAVKRIGNVLKALEIQAPPQSRNITIKPRVILKQVTVDFKTKNILRDINVTIDLGLNLINGPVGCGKTCLLKTILQDYKTTSGSLITYGRISYASQEPWLFPSSIKQNIVFGETYNEARYQEVLSVCALKYDFDLLTHGDSTIVEDRGNNLSKGQQARINLARAVYKDSEIYLLDDCLSALDAHVSEFIFYECFKKFLRNKLVILVTHNTKHLGDVDNLIVMNDGTVKSVAKPEELNIKDLNIENEKKTTHSNVHEEKEEDATEKCKLITETTTEKKIYQETKKDGKVDISVYKKYMRFSGGFFSVLFVIAMFALAQFVTSYADKLVSVWVNLEQDISNYTNYNNSSNSSDLFDIKERRNRVLNFYTIMTISTALFNLAKSFALFWIVRKASTNLHTFMTNRIINASMQFFDTNFIGNILNRFSKDLSAVDEHMPFVFYQVITVFLMLCGVVTLIAMVNPSFLIPIGVCLFILVIVRKLYLSTGRSLKRLDAITRSPVIGHLNATLEGLTTIRAFKAEDILRDEFDRHQDLYTSATYTSQCSMRAFSFCLDFLSTMFIAIIVWSFVFWDNGTLAGMVGLAITQAFKLTGTLQWGVRQWAEIENSMTSVERVLEYTEVKQENKQGAEIKDWPEKGEVKYENVYLQYPSSDEHVLKDINFVVQPKEKIGIVGRTGAGKSSIISSLFRLYEVKGRILIDDVDTKTLSLDCLRRNISIIPQDPVLFTGTVRNNIDPTNEYTDEEIWRAVESANLKSIVPDLDFRISENGTNFSVGQRQLICLARAMVRNNKIIVLDEATANMDSETDALIHQTLKINFAACTVFTIAHKLQSVISSDKVMVLDQGEIMEYDEPSKLLKNKDSIFYNMVLKSGLTLEQ